MKRLVFLLVISVSMMLPSCVTIFGGSSTTAVAPGMPRETIEFTETKRQMVDVGVQLAEEIKKEGSQAGDWRIDLLIFVLKALQRSEGVPISPVSTDKPVAKLQPEVKQLADRLAELTKLHRKAEEEWIKERSALVTENEGLKKKASLLATLGTGIKYFVSLAILLITAATAVYMYLVKGSTAKTVGTAVVGAVLLAVWLYFAQEIIFLALIVAGGLLLYAVYQMIRGSIVEKWFRDTIQALQLWRISRNTDGGKDERDKLDEQLAALSTTAKNNYVDDVKDERSLPRTNNED